MPKIVGCFTPLEVKRKALNKHFENFPKSNSRDFRCLSFICVGNRTNPSTSGDKKAMFWKFSISQLQLCVFVSVYSSEITSVLCLRIRFKDLPRLGLTLGIVGSLRVNFRRLRVNFGNLRKSPCQSTS